MTARRLHLVPDSSASVDAEAVMGVAEAHSPAVEQPVAGGPVPFTGMDAAKARHFEDSLLLLACAIGVGDD